MTTQQIKVQRAKDRGHADFGWLQANYSFSFARYWNPERQGFGSLLVLNDDRIAPGRGFDTHGHQDMEIITIPLAGSLKHRDSMGQEGLLQTGEVQVMSAGTGILHSEFNASETQTLELFQIWILPEAKGLTPRYDQKTFDWQEAHGSWQNLVSKNENNGSLHIYQNAKISHVILKQDESIQWLSKENQGQFAMVISGEILVNQEISLANRDSLENRDGDLSFQAKAPSHLLIIESPL